MKTFKYIAVAMLMIAAFEVTNVFADGENGHWVYPPPPPPPLNSQAAAEQICPMVCANHGGWMGGGRDWGWKPEQKGRAGGGPLPSFPSSPATCTCCEGNPECRPDHCFGDSQCSQGKTCNNKTHKCVEK